MNEGSESHGPVECVSDPHGDHPHCIPLSCDASKCARCGLSINQGVSYACSAVPPEKRYRYQITAAFVQPTQASPAMRKQVGGDHYKGLAIQPAEYCQRNRLPYCESSVIQYVTRHRDKNGAEDIRKAIHCLEMLLEMEYPES